MNDHLTHDEIMAVVAGAATRGMGEHVRDCGTCRAETERLTEMLSMFRQSVWSWSAEQEPQESLARSPKRVSRRWLGWAAAGATVCVIVGLTLPRSFNKSAPVRQSGTSISVASIS